MTTATLPAPRKLTDDQLGQASVLKTFGYCESIMVGVAFVMFEGQVHVYGICRDHETSWTLVGGSLGGLLKLAFEAGDNVAKVYRDIII